VNTLGDRRRAWQPEGQSKLDVLGGPPATAAEAVVQAEHRLNLARQIVKIATRIDRRFLATSDPLQLTSGRRFQQTVIRPKMLYVN